MKTLIRFPILLVLGALAATRLPANIESLKIEPLVMPRLSPAMEMHGITEGKVVFAIDVNAEGKLTDWIVLGYTHPALVTPCVDALKGCKISAARIDGRPTAVQTELTVDFRAEGVVISRSPLIEIDQDIRRISGYRIQLQQRGANELDQLPVRLETVSPHYAKDAADKGVRGTVQVHFYIDETGAVRMPAVESSADPYLSDMALDAVRAWRFTPPVANGRPVLVAARQEFNFNKP